MTQRHTWEIGEAVLEATTPPGQIQTQLDSILDRSHNQDSDTQEWETTSLHIYQTRITLNPVTGEIRITRYTTNHFKHATQAALLLSPLFILSILTTNPLLTGMAGMTIYGLIIFLFTPMVDDNLDILDEYTTKTRERLNPYIFAHGTVLLAIGAATTYRLTPSSIISELLIGGIGILLILVYFINGRDAAKQNNNHGFTQFTILFASLQTTLIPIAVLLPFLVFNPDPTNFHVMQTQAKTVTAHPVQTFVLLTTILVTATPFVIATARPRHNWVALIPPPLIYLAMQTDYALAYMYYSIPVLMLLGLAVMTKSLSYPISELTTNIREQELPPFQSPFTKYGLLIGCVTANITGITVLAAATSFLLTTTPIGADSVLFISAEHTQTTIQILDILFDAWPLLPAAVYRTIFLLTIFSPVIVFVTAWLYNIGKNTISKIILWLKTTPIEHLSDAIPDTVQIRRLPGGIPEVRPVATALGMKQSIIVGDVVLDELSDDELDAVLAHEAYHLKNRDHVVNLIAGILAVFIGGRNAFLVFYDYPRVEREADRYAAETVGQQPLIRALRTMDLLWKRAVKGGGKPLQAVYPGFIFERSQERPGVLQNMKVLYALYFGNVLLEAAHVDIEDRINRIQEM